MKSNLLLKSASASIALVLSISANAALVSRMGGQAVYDDINNLTWLSDANYAATSAYSGTYDGTMDHTVAESWIDSLNVANHLGVNDWRLPTTAQPDPSCDSVSGTTYYGDNCTGSEYGDLYYNQLNSGEDINNFFTNVGGGYYWSATEYTGITENFWAFNLISGYQFVYSDTNNNYALAVRTGDIGPVPVPAAVWLFGSGLFGLIGVARRKNTKQTM